MITIPDLTRLVNPPGALGALLDNIHGISGQIIDGLRLEQLINLYSVQEKSSIFNHEKFNESRKLRYQLQDISKDILSESEYFGRFQKCYRVPIGEYVRIIHSDTTKTAHWNGLSICANIWACPVCGTKIMSERCRELESAIERFTHADIKNHEVLMMVLTHSHTRHDSLENLMEKKAKALAYFFSHRDTKEALKSVKSIGHVNSAEITYSKLNGWHPHNHVLFFNEIRSNQEELKLILYPVWEAACIRQGLSTNPDCFKIQGGNYTSHYITKLHQEMTLSNMKLASGRQIPHYTPMQLLYTVQEYKKLGKHTGWLQAAYYEYAHAMKGRKQLVYSRGLKDKLAMIETHDFELAQPTEKDLKELIYFRSNEFRKLKDPSIKAHALKLAEKKDFEALEFFFKEHGIRIFIGKDFNRNGGET